MKLKFEGLKGEVAKIGIKPLEIAKGKPKPFGNGYHVLLKKDTVEGMDRRKSVWVLFFEWENGNEEHPDHQ